MLQIKNLQFKNISYPKSIIIKDVPMTFLTGTSGRGKSTLLKLINGSLVAEQGEFFLNQYNLTEIDPIKRRKLINLVSQEPFLFNKSIIDNFKEYYNYCEEKIISNEDMKFFLNLCQINFDLDAKCQTLSGGEKQRVFMAICLSFKSPIILLDEPTSSLDSETAINLLSNLKEYFSKNKIYSLIICHNQNLVNKFADDEIHLD